MLTIKSADQYTQYFVFIKQISLSQDNGGLITSKIMEKTLVEKLVFAVALIKRCVVQFILI